MKVRPGSRTGEPVPSLPQTLDDGQAQLAADQERWAEQLARDPASFAHLETEVHRSSQHLADRFIAGLLAHAAGQPALDQAAKKKERKRGGRSVGPNPAACGGASRAG